VRIVLTHPYCWPYVRRGSERFIAELARYLTGRGYEVITVSGKPGPGLVERTDAGKRVLYNHFWVPSLGRIRVTPVHTFVPALMHALQSIKADFVHSLSYLDAWAANLFRKRRGYRTVYQVTGPPVPHWLPRIPPDRQAVRRAICRSDRVMAHSAFTAGIVREYYGVDPKVIPVPIDLPQFPLKNGPAPKTPVILAVASFDEPRKGLRVLVRAFEILKRSVPEAVLRLSGSMSPEVQREVIAPLPAVVRADIQVLGVGMLDDLPQHYRQASLTVLPSMWEAYGMTVVESWASGTPVVVTDHAGLCELVDDPALGRLFDPQTDGQEALNAKGLADAILAALPLAENEQARQRCRARAERYSWEALGPEYEQLYAGP